MTINELRDLLTFVDDDPVKAFIVRDIIRQKVNMIKSKRQQGKNKREKTKDDNDLLQEVLKELKEQQTQEPEEEEYDDDFDVYSQDSLDELNDIIEQKYNPLRKDRINGDMKSRFGSDIEIHKNQLSGGNRKMMGLFGDDMFMQ
jgi:hypothetical protein